MKFSFIKKFIAFLILLGAVTVGVLFWIASHRTPELTKLTPTAVTFDSPSSPTPSNGDSKTEVKPLPASLLIKVPFTPQAPTANWDELHNEACEEASSIMAYAYFSKIKSLPADTVEQEISTLTNWQNQTLGYHLSITTEEVVKMIKENYNLKAEVVPMAESTIKQALAENKLVIWPGNGQLIKNPYYKQPGPIYHMMLITGYNEQGLITNDPGTRRGQDYQYDYQTLYNASGTWDHSRDEVDLSKKNIIIVSL